MVQGAWGKFSKEAGTFHPLAHHCMDVATVFMKLVQMPIVRNRLTEAAGQPVNDLQFDRLAVLVFLHDVGKLHPGFQAKAWQKGSWRGKPRGHLSEGWSFVILAAKDRDHPFHHEISQILRWGEESVVSDLFHVMFAHHGRPVAYPANPTNLDWHNPSHNEYDWRKEAESFRDTMMHWFGDAFNCETEMLPNSERFHHELAGLVVLSDWLGSDESVFRHKSPLSIDYKRKAQKRASQALKMFHPNAELLAALPPPDFTGLTGYASPNPMQSGIGAVDPAEKLVILEAETGSGKTEAALWRFTQLLATGMVSGLYFAVPTRAAARQLHLRVVKAMQRAYGDKAPEVILAIPGMLRAGEFDGKMLPGWEVRWSDDKVKVPERWAAEQANRFLAATVAVGTVDQAMLASLTVKHAHLRGTTLSHNLLVIDEVHASDAYMTEIIHQLLRGHLAVGGYAMLMSATLGARARARWMDKTTPDYNDACDTAYPAIWTHGKAAPCAVRQGSQSKTVLLRSTPTMCTEEAAKSAIAYARQGARVIVIRNMVKTAIETWRAVKDQGEGSLLMQVNGGAALHHSRFAAEDRSLLDNAVESILKPDKGRKSLGCIVIGTQTLEQSLDIDADYLITDLCPIDVLLQRIGRLHRHTKLRRPEGFESASCEVLIPEEGLDNLADPEPAFDNGLGAWEDDGMHGIYQDLASLELTRRLIAEQSEWNIPEMNRALVEGATHPQRIDELLSEKGEAWIRYENKVCGSRIAESMHAKMNTLDRNRRFDGDLEFPDADDRIMTRLGEDGIVLNLPDPVEGPFGSEVNKITLPARWSRGLRGDEDTAIETTDNGLKISVGSHCYLYTREGLDRDS